MFNLREKIIQDMYDAIFNENLKSEMKERFEKIMDKVDDCLPVEMQDEMLGMICELEHVAFFAGANMVLNFISGKEMQQHE